MTEDVVSGLRTEIETLYDSAIKNAKRAENLVSSVFGDIKGNRRRNCCRNCRRNIN